MGEDLSHHDRTAQRTSPPRPDFRSVFGGRPPLIGVVHLAPLPGSPASLPMRVILERAEQDARAWFEGGADAVIVENFGDVPFHAARVPPITVASMARVLGALRPLGRLGVNVLRNDAEAALALCRAFELTFLRVNVLAGVTVTDQGLIQGDAAGLMRERALAVDPPLVLADLDVKHGRPLVERPLEAQAEELFHRAAADALLLTGETTGRAPSPGSLRDLAARLPSVPCLAASGVDPEFIAATHGAAAGWIVSTWAKGVPEASAPPDPNRIQRLRKAVDAG